MVVPSQGPVDAGFGVESREDEQHGQDGLAKHDADDGGSQASEGFHDGGCGMGRGGEVSASTDSGEKESMIYRASGIKD